MKKLKTLLAAFMTAAMVLTMTGCDEEEPLASKTSADAGANNVEMDDEAVNEAAKALVDKASYPDLKVEKRIKWMAWWPMDETSGAAVLFKELYGIPETGDDPDSEGRIFEYHAVAYGNHQEILSTLIGSDEQPDLFPFEIKDFPYGILARRYQPIEDIVDFSEDKWANYRELNDQFMINGKHYTAACGYTLQDLMWYKKSNIEAIGADDPQELFLQGKWDWDAFLDISRKWQQSGDSRYSTDGYAVDKSFVITTGVPLVGTDGTNIVSNLYSPDIERAVNGIIATLAKEDLRYPRQEYGDSTDPAKWSDDETLFFCEGTWRYEETLQKFKQKYKWADDEIKVVPYPKDPKADKYYVQMKIDPEMWVKGSTNAAGVQAWLDCKVTAAADKALHDASNAKMIKNPLQNYTQEIVDFLDTLYGLNGDCPVTPIVDFCTGLGTNVSTDENGKDTSLAPVWALTVGTYLEGESYTQNREANKDFINIRIDEINAEVKLSE